MLPLFPSPKINTQTGPGGRAPGTCGDYDAVSGAFLSGLACLEDIQWGQQV